MLFGLYHRANDYLNFKKSDGSWQLTEIRQANKINKAD